MTQKEYREGIKVLKAIHQSLSVGLAFKRSMSAKYPNEELACEGLSALQIATAKQLSSDIEDLWRDAK